MTWLYAKQMSREQKLGIVILLAGRRVGFCEGMNQEEGKVKLLVCTPRPGRMPTPIVTGKGAETTAVDAFVRAPFLFAEDVLGTSGATMAPHWAYLTMSGWVDEKSEIVPEPWEICEP